MTGETILELAMAKRAQQGLRLTWFDENGECVTAYPKDDAQRQAWIASGTSKGWELIDDASWNTAA